MVQVNSALSQAQAARPSPRGRLPEWQLFNWGLVYSFSAGRWLLRWPRRHVESVFLIPTNSQSQESPPPPKKVNLPSALVHLVATPWRFNRRMEIHGLRLAMDADVCGQRTSL